MKKKETIEILIVEDSPTQAERLKYLLQEHGYRVCVSANGKEALDAMRRRKPDLIIGDIVMPVMDGFEMCKTIKHDETLRDIPVILLTELSEPNDIVRGLSAGANNYVVKPYEDEYILSKVKSFLAYPSNRKAESIQEEVEVSFAGKRHSITTDSQQILAFMISTYENVIYQNRELTRAQARLKKLNQQLETKVLELKSSQSELQTSEERFKTFVKMLPDIIYQIDHRGCFTFLNNAVQSLGYMPSELIGKHFSSLMLSAVAKEVSSFEVLKKYAGRRTGDKDAPKIFDERRTGERGTKLLEVMLIPKAGGKGTPAIVEPIGDDMVIVEINSSGLYENNIDTGNRKLVGSVGVIRDITERKMIEKEIRRLNTELEQRVIERTRELNETNVNLANTLDKLNIAQQQMIQSEKMAALGTLISGIAHELNNPMMGILNYVQYVRKRVSDKADEKLLEKAEKETARCINVVKNMLNYSIPSKGELTEVDCVTIVKDTLNTLSAYSYSKNIKISINMPETLTPVLANSYSLQQILLNILINALDAMENSPVKELCIEGSEEKERVIISIRDTGTGIPREIIQRIFDPFFTTKPPGKGTGLGLSISQNLIRGFDGRLTCESIMGKGTMFTITLPIMRPAV